VNGTQAGNSNDDSARLKSVYAAAVRKTFPADAKDSDVAREHQRFLDRLRFRLCQGGVSSDEIDRLGKAEAARGFVAGPVPELATLAYRDTAILVIHGIGQQNPYETLDQFARNLTRYLRHEGEIDDLTMSPQRIDHNDWTEVMLRLQTSRHGPTNPVDPQAMPGEAHIDLYEYYWAPQTQDKISYRQTLDWLIRTTLTPIKLLSQNVAIMDGESDEGLTKPAILARELRRITWIYAPMLLAFVFLLLWLPSAANIPGVVSDFAKQGTGNNPWSLALMALLFLQAALLYVVALRQFVSAALVWVRQEGSPAIAKRVARYFVAPVLFTLAGLVVAKWRQVGLASYFQPLLHFSVLKLLLAMVFARIIQVFLKDFVGDVAVYVNADAKAKNYAARRAILSGATTALTRILKDTSRSYQQVIVAGHSLGSVIAYDLLNDLMNRRLGTPDQVVGVVPPDAQISQGDLDKIKGLVTFGSPLDKVYYFFREYVPAEQTVRAQISSFLHSFRKRPSQSDYGVNKFQPYTASSLDHVLWLNAWSKEDPVSGMLHFYRNVQRQQFDYTIPTYAHLSYWEDWRFYDFFSRPMLLGKALRVAPQVKRFTA